MDGTEFFIALFLVLLVGIPVLLLIREIVVWYYKIPQMLNHQQQMVTLLERIANSLDDADAADDAAQVAPPPVTPDPQQVAPQPQPPAPQPVQPVQTQPQQTPQRPRRQNPLMG